MVASPNPDGKVVWRSTLTVIVLGKNRSKGAAASSAPMQQPEVMNDRLGVCLCSLPHVMMSGDVQIG